MTVFSVILQLFLSPMKSNVAIQQWGTHHLITMQYILSWQEFKACIFQHSKPSGQEFYQIKQRMIDVSPCSELQEGMSHCVSLSWATKKGAVSKNTGLVCPNANTLTPSNGAFYMNWNDFDIQLPNSEHQMTVWFFFMRTKNLPWEICAETAALQLSSYEHAVSLCCNNWIQPWHAMQYFAAKQDAQPNPCPIHGLGPDRRVPRARRCGRST